VLIGFFEADAGAIGAAKLNGDVDQPLQYNLGSVSKDAGEGLQGFESGFCPVGSVPAIEKLRVGEEILEFHSRVF
jgi:hypothetical protein